MAEGKLRSWDMKRFLWDGVHRIVLTLEDLDKPVIAAINGAAMGAGLDMALMCDLRVVSDKAKLAESYITMGLVPGDGGAYFLPRLVNTSKALDFFSPAMCLMPKKPYSSALSIRLCPMSIFWKKR
jgi:enoyl-CoA hydratase/carnithine racemase